MSSDPSVATDVLAAWRQSRPGGLGALFDDDEIDAYSERARLVGIDAAAFYAECRLGSARQLDFLVSLRRDDLAAPKVAASLDRWCEPGARFASAWDTARRFCLRWRTPGDDVHDLASSVWLELDDVKGGAATFGPSLSACVVPGYPQAPADRDSTRKERTDRVMRVHRALAGDRDGTTAALLRLCCDALPDRGRAIHLSTMSARDPVAAKLYAVMPRREVVPYLRLVGWRGPLAAVESILSRIATTEICGDAAYLDLNLANLRLQDQTTVGIAFSQQQTAGDPRRRALLRRLVQGGLCGVRQAELLADWVAPNRDGGRPRVVRWLDVKLVIGARDLVAKAYLGYRLDWNPFVIGY